MAYDPLVSPAVRPDLPLPATYWHATHTPAKLPVLADDRHTKTLVIGGGYTGLNAAITLAQAGEDVTLIDSHQPGFGCAGRNGGFVLSGTGRLSLSAIAKKWNTDIALGMQAEFDQAVQLIKSRIISLNQDVGAVEGPYFKVAFSAKHARALARAQATNKQAFATEGEYVTADVLQKQLQVSGAHGGVIQPGLALHPLKLADASVQYARAEGATLYAQTPALSIEKKNGGYRVTTPQGDIHCEQLLLATNAYSPKQFHPLLDKRQFPVQSSIIVTPPLSASQQQATGLRNPLTAMDTRMMKYYYRVLPDGRVLFGGRGAVTGEDKHEANAKARLLNAMYTSFPALKGLGAEYFWSGWVSVSLDSLPRIHWDANARIGYAGGYCGSGVSFASLAGTRLAQLTRKEAVNTQLPIYQGHMPVYPFAPLRRMGLRALYAWARIAER